MRIGVESPDALPFSAVEVTDVLDAALADWHADPLSTDESGTWVITGHVDVQVGTAEYARRAHTLVQELLATGSVHRAEADLPVTAFVAPGVPITTADVPPGSEEKRWARDAIRCDEAWVVEPGRGEGIRIGHPDTGYTLHTNQGRAALDLATDRDVIDDDDDALDPLVDPAASPWPLPFPGHGTTTASVIAGRGSEEAGIVGVAPRARVVPLRAVESVVQLFDSDVARAVEHARLTGCHLVSISVGGKGFFGLRAAIQRAVDAGMIVMGAAGNNVRIVVAPASYPNCLAVAATGPDDQPWPESSRGRAVDVSAPGWGVYVAGYVWENGVPAAVVGQSSGTSYAVTHLAGVAALWLAHHGPEELQKRYGAGVQAAFLHLLGSGGSRVPEDWDAARYGAGVVDAAAMLTAPLPAGDEFAASLAAPAESPLARLSLLVNVDEAQLEHALARRLVDSGEDLHEVVTRFEGELAFHLIEDPEFRACLLGPVPAESVPCGTRTACSPEFATLFL
ncbi:MAG: S8 family serine peptidase [Leifsonia flava]